MASNGNNAKTKTVKRAPKNRVQGLTANQMIAVMSATIDRARLAGALGQTYGGDRDLYTALGYKGANQIQFADYQGKYRRQDVAKAIIDAPVKASWRKLPSLSESQDDETEFERKWDEIVKARKVFHYLSRVDRLACMGEYAVLLLGFDDQGDLNTEVTRASTLLYLTPYSETNAAIKTWVDDTKDERYGQPLTYQLTMRKAAAGGTNNQIVHWSRIIHVAADVLETDVYGTPVLESVFNRLEDLEKVIGSAAEMFWRNAPAGLALKADDDATFTKQDLDDLDDEVKEFIHGLRRYMRLEGMSVEEIKQQIADPSKHVSALLDLISAATRIPKRILMGSERGELASGQDEKNWADHVDQRRQDHCEPSILRPFVDRLITMGVLPEVADGYAVQWPDLLVPGAKDVAEVAQKNAAALKSYVESGASELMAPEMFLRKELGWTQDDIDRNEELLKAMRDAADSDDDLDLEDDE